MHERPNVLIFYTATYPFGIVETFIETELQYLANRFDKIVIVSNNVIDNNLRPVPTNAVIERKPYFAPPHYKLKALLESLDKNVLAELANIRQNLKLPLSKPVLSILLASLANGLSFADFTDDLIKKYKLEGVNLYLYSYWLNDAAIGIAWYRYKNRSVKAFCRAHRWDIYQDQQKHKYAALRPFIFANLNACYPISYGGASYLNSITENKFNDTIRVARLGSLPLFPHAHKAPKSKFRLLSCSYVISLKRIHLIIQALSKLDNLHIEWVHLGGGPLFENIKERAEESVKGNVSFDLKGLMTHTQICEYYRQNEVDLFINVSELEGVPVSIMEANSCAVPAIATNVGGVPDLVNEKTGFLLDVNANANEIAAVIAHYYYLSPEKKEEYRRNAFMTWSEKFNAEKNYSRFVQEILSL